MIYVWIVLIVAGVSIINGIIDNHTRHDSSGVKTFFWMAAIIICLGIWLSTKLHN